MKNYEDSKCSFGYMTVCDPCVPKVRKSIALSHVNVDKEVKGFPIVECEVCGRLKHTTQEPGTPEYNDECADLLRELAE